MRTYCMRSACRGHAVVLVVISVAEGSFTVRNLAEVDGPGRVVLCEKHLDRLSAPIGWSLLDERTGGDVIAFPGPGAPVPPSTVAGLIEAPTPRPVAAAMHPLALARKERAALQTSESEPAPEREIARAALGVDRHPAGIFGGTPSGSVGPVEDLDVEGWDRTMAVNVRSAFLCCRRAVPAMRAAGGGSILLTSSTAGFTGFPMRSPYAASKYAIVGLGDTLAMEVGEFGIRVNVLCPGSVDGDRMVRVIDAEAAATGESAADLRATYEKQVSMRTFVEGRDIAAMAVFLASPAARFVNGQTISVDGGLETLRTTWRT